ncbi:MAG: hypothetical protein ACYC61_01605 [Isosphaeraceae bacterium]
MTMRPDGAGGEGMAWGLSWLLAVLCGSMAAGGARGQEPPASGVTLDGLLRMSPAEIELVYRQGTAVAIPPGRVRGTALLAPGTRRARALSRGARLVWQGKVIEPDGTTAINRFLGIRMIRGQLYQGPSWLDGAPSLILDYSQTSRVYAGNRDEIRQVAPGLYLGLMYDRTTTPPRLSMYFALEAIN